MVPHSTRTILRRRQVEAVSGYSRSTIYLRIAQGLLPKPVSLGPRAVGWPSDEVDAINTASHRGQVGRRGPRPGDEAPRGQADGGGCLTEASAEIPKHPVLRNYDDWKDR